MSSNFLLANAISSIINSRVPIAFIPCNNVISSIVNVLASNGFIKDVAECDTDNRRIIKIEKTIDAHSGKFIMKKIKLLSKPSRRVYLSASELKDLHSRDRFRFYIISTSSGVLSIEDALKKSIGGELICEVCVN